MEKIKLSFLLDLFNTSYNKAYFSVAEFNSQRNVSYVRMEMIIPELGRLCLYQTFAENYDGEQIPYFKVYYYSADNKNLRTSIIYDDLLKKAVGIIYKTKKFCEDNPWFQIESDKDLSERNSKNKKYLKKIYEQNLQNNKRGWLGTLLSR